MTGTSTSSRVLRWPDDLPLVRAFDPGTTPTRALLSLAGALQHDDEGSGRALAAASLIRGWWSSLDDRGQRLDPYPDLRGDGYLLSAIQLVSQVASTPTVDGAWSPLRRAEANIRAWYLERGGGAVPVVMVEDAGPPVPRRRGGWSWIWGDR